MRSKLMPKGRLRVGSFYFVFFILMALTIGLIIGQISFNKAVDYRLHQLETQVSPVVIEPEVEATEEEVSRGSVERDLVSLGMFNISYYCKCELCTGKSDGITATGTIVEEGRTIAVDPDVIPLGTQVMIDGLLYTAEDVGSAIQGNRIDIYVDRHAYAIQCGRHQAEVFIAVPYHRLKGE